jgi:hypothetical protein
MSVAQSQPPILLGLEQRKRLEKLLTEHYVKDDLEHLVSFKLGIVKEDGQPLHQLDGLARVAQVPWGVTVGDLVAKVVEHFKVRELILGMLDLPEANADVRQLATELGILSLPQATDPPAPPAADAEVVQVKLQAVHPSPIPLPGADTQVIQVHLQTVHQRILDGKRWMEYLKAYKQLHESVHVLQQQLEAIGQALDAARTLTAKRRNLRRVAVVLAPLVTQAREGADSTDSPKDQGDWVLEFGKAVEALKNDADSTNFSPLETAIDTLRALPNRQGHLNKELVRCAKCLDREKLLESIEAALHDLRANHGTAPGDLLQKLERFRGNCDRLGPLVEEHNRCQSIDGVLAGLQAYTDAAAAGKCQEKHIYLELKAISDSRAKDTVAREATEAARKFEVASPLKLSSLPEQLNAVPGTEPSARTSLGGQFRSRLREVLLDQFPTRGDLEMLLSDCLTKNLDAVAGGSNLEEIVFNLIRWAVIDPPGRLQPLLTEAVKGRPNSTDLAVLLHQLNTAIAETPWTEDRKDLLKFFGDLFLAIDKELRELTKQMVIEAAELATDLGSIHHGVHNGSAS